MDLSNEEVPPQRRCQEEISLYESLQKVYSMNNNTISIKVSGKKYELTSFHYFECHHFVDNARKKFELIDKNESMLLVRWELKGAIATLLMYDGKLVKRVFLPLCR